MISRRYIVRPAVAALWAVMAAISACAHSSGTQNSLAQHTGQAGSTFPRTEGPQYPNTSGNIIAPPGNPGGNPSSAPPIVGGTTSQQTAWPEAR